MTRRGRLPVLGLVISVIAALFSVPAAHADAGKPAPIGSDRVTWQQDLQRAGGEDVNVAIREGKLVLRDGERRFASLGQGRAFGTLTFRPRTLETQVNRIRAAVDAKTPAGTSVETGVRIRNPHGWSEWTEITPQDPAVLSERASRVQVRITLYGNERGQSPAVSHVRLAADSVPTVQERSRAVPRTYDVFATREGLVGETTANGHVIEPRDHFVALPSTRSLSPENEGDYSVMVCSRDTGRCAFAPVWDVGPWNIHDDYWSPPSVRENWTDLPQGTPEAEAAYHDGYNNGKDGSGREVLNPAGIDLADGTFWDAVGLDDNAWVDVTYLWTGTYPATGEVGTGGRPLRVRAGPTTDAPAVGLAGQHAQVPIHCQARGETIDGYYGRSSLWNRVGPDMFVSAAYTNTEPDTRIAPRC